MKNISITSNHFDHIDDSLSIGNSSATFSCSNHYVPPSIKLAGLEIPTFSGSYIEWSSYYDIYMTLVHNNKS